MNSKNIYLSNNINKSADELIGLARHKSMPVGYYTIVVSNRDDELLTMYESKQVNTDYFVSMNHHIVGFGRGKYTTKSLISDIIADIYTDTGDITKESLRSIGN